jgi:hypothetical protein
MLSRAIAFALGLLLFPSFGLAGDQDNRFDVNADGTSVDFDLHQVPRRDVLNRLFADRGVKVDWLNRDVADEAIRGHFTGPPSAVARQILAPLNFILALDKVDGETRITRVIVVGRSSGTAAPALAVIEAAMKKAETPPPAQPKQPDPARTGASTIRPLVVAGTAPSNLPKPTPIKTADPLPVPAALPVPANVPPPTPRDVVPPPFVPVFGAGPPLPGPQQVGAAK